MTDGKEGAARLLEAASARLKSVSDETPAFNILSVLQLERYETRTHSKIIFFLLSSRQNGENRFLRLFLEMLKIPKKFQDEHWSVYREQPFDKGAGRIDFVLESASYCAIIEMKIDAEDGDSQLARYGSFGRKKRKNYGIYYLTLDGHDPEEQSIENADSDRLWCISFEKGIISWLEKCMDVVPENGWQYSFLKQYLGTVRQITGMGGAGVSVADLINSSDMARAALLVMDSFEEKINEVQEQFFQKLDAKIRKKTGLSSCLYTNGIDLMLGEFSRSGTMYYADLGIFFGTYLYVCFGFSEKAGDGGYHYIPLADAQDKFPRTYRKWMKKLDALEDLSRFCQSELTRWSYLLDSEGSKLDFQAKTAQIRLIDEMETLCRWFADDVVRHWILPLTRE